MTISLRPGRDAFGAIDVQPAFMPGGDLPTPDGNAVVLPINRLLEAPFAFRFATQDWHPPGNVTFASSHPGRKPFDEIDTGHGRTTLWPDHAIQGTSRAELHLALTTRLLDIVIRKGAGRDLEGYSPFGDLGGRLNTGFAEMMRARGVERLFLAGLALDVCVAATASDGAREGFEVFVVEDASRAGKADQWARLKASLEDLGIRFILERELVAAGADGPG